MYAPGVTVLVPLKPLAEAKSRLRGAAPDHEDLVLALALATVRAALTAAGVARVLVVTRDPVAAAELRGCGADVAADHGRDLNDALRRAAAEVTGPVAALPADLPALRPAELAQALAAAGGRRAFVPDAAGVGTVLLVAAPGRPLDPRFGSGSAAAHERTGAARLTGDWPTLRRDVDTADDLAVVRGWGLLPTGAKA
ncbi:2-phospho-L-lactate guanylyltransferase [Catellatospora sp. IY07-71]|uniref:2-phospho-L-lactate guanylyltransferase n=1 Tax=Catellatospora sp. IY07-71 TaxID=2728827 RepID=UPI001BB6FBCD|nr:2-phospho-L-lactate guanylyltransferase [Catellatospora sp. IY07-71]BCJ72766.1 2-phospho-L-lactate guanylyltransferase [Catellatospora sp. IY07-71]